MSNTNESDEREVAAIAEEAYIFFFPMLMSYRAIFGTFLAPSARSYGGPLNTLSGEPVTLDYTFKDVISPNADTPYTMAGLDLRAEPLVLSVPAVTDRYYVMQFEDLFGTNAHYVGTRSTGANAGDYLLTGPGWHGDGLADIGPALTFETDVVFLIGRTQLLGADDAPALGKVMSEYKLQPLSSYMGTPQKEAPPFDWPVWDDAASRDERFIAIVNALLPLCQPTHPEDAEHMERFSRIGIGPGVPFDVTALDSDTQTALRSGVEAARQHVADAAANLGEKVNGWSTTDAFGNRAWFGGNYRLRAAGAMAGWGGNDKVEAYYPIAREDADGRPFDGRERYRLTFNSFPPARAFWSVTMYDTSYDGTAGYLVENPIDRYLINSTTDGLAYGDDGFLTIAIQRSEPGTLEEKANWLPAPDGPFYLVLRIYWPERSALDGSWTPPPVRRIQE